MRRLLAAILSGAMALEPVAAATPYYRTKPISGAASASLGPIKGPSPIKTHTQTLVDAQYTVDGASNPQWSATGLPAGLNMSSGGIVSGTVAQVGAYQATVTVSADGATESETVPVDVFGSLAVTIPQAARADMYVQSSLPTPNVTGDPIPQVTYTLQGGALPPNMFLDGTTGVVSGTPTSGGSYTYSIRVTDGSGADAISNTQTVTVADGATLTMAAVKGRVGTPLVAVSPKVTGTPYGGTLTYALSGAALPAGLTLDNATGTVSGQPTAATPGDAAIPYTLVATDGTGKGKPIPFTVEVDAPLAFANGAGPTSLVMRANQYATLPALEVAHAPTLPGKWAVASGSLPAGVQINPNTGVFFGTPAGPVGTTALTVAFVDGSGTSITSGPVSFKIVNALAIVVPDGSSTPVKDPANGYTYYRADTGTTLYAPTPSLTGKPYGAVTWKVVDDGPALAAAGQAQTPPVKVPDTDPLPPTVTYDPTTGQVFGTNDSGAQSTLHYEVSDQSGAPPVVSTPFEVWFDTDFKVGEVAGITLRIGDTGHTVTPTVTNTKTGQSLANDTITWSKIPFCGSNPPQDFGLNGITFDAPSGRVGGTAGLPGTGQGYSETYQLYAVDTYHSVSKQTPDPVPPGYTGVVCPVYGDLATNAFTVSVLPALTLADTVVHTHVGVAATDVPDVRNQPTYPISWSLTQGSLPSGMTLAPVTVDGTYPAIYGAPMVTADVALVIQGEDSSVNEASADGTGHDSVLGNVHVVVTPEPTLGPTANETGRTRTGHTIKGPTVTGDVIGTAHWSLKGDTARDAGSTGLIADANGKPTGLSLDPSTGTVSGVPTLPIHTTVTLNFVDDAGGPGVDAQPFSVDLLPALVIDDTIPKDSSGARAIYAHTGTPLVPNGPSVENSPTGTLAWTLSGVSPLPSGLAFDKATGILSGTPNDVSNVNGIPFPGASISVRDQAVPVPATALEAFALYVYPALTVNPVSDVNYVRVGHPFAMSAPLVGNGPNLPVAWSFLQGPLPVGTLTMDASGNLSGTPTAPLNASFTYKVVDATGAVGIGASPFLIDIEPPLALDAPADVVTYVGGAPLTLPYVADNAAKQSATPYLTLHNKPVGQAAYSMTGGAALPSDLTIDRVTGVISGKPTAVAATTPFQVHAIDQSLAGDAADSPVFNVTVQPPMTLAATSTDTVFRVNVPGSLVLSQPANPVGRVTWTVDKQTPFINSNSLGTAGTLSGTPEKGSASARAIYTFTATDQGLPPQALSTTAAITVLDPLTVEPMAAQPNATINEPYTSSTPVADNVDPAHPVTWAFAPGTAIPEMSVDPSTGIVSGTPTKVGGPYPISLVVTDDLGNTSNPMATTGGTVAVTVPPVLAIEPIPAQPAGRINVAYASTGKFAVDNLRPGKTATWSFAAGSAIPGLTVNPSTGALSGTPTTPGPYPLALTVTDGAGATAPATSTPTITIYDAVKATSPTLSTVPLGVRTTLATPVLQNNPTPTVSWAYSGSVPNNFLLDPSTGLGLTFDTKTGGWSGIPALSGSFPFTLTGTDGTGLQSGTPVTIQVRPFTASRTTLVTHAGTPVKLAAQTLAGNPITLPGFPPVTPVWGLIKSSDPAAQLPSGVDLNKDGTIQGTFPNAGVYDISTTVTDAMGNAGVAAAAYTGTTPAPAGYVPAAAQPVTPLIGYEIQVRPPLTASAVASASMRALKTGQVVQAPAVAGNPLLPLSFTIAGDTLPSTLSFDKTLGTISGTPANADVGTYNETVTVTDATGVSVPTNAFQLTVTGAFVATAPATVLTHVGASPNAAASTPPLTNGVGPTFSYALASGTLPPGLSVDASTGSIDGPATAIGSASITTTVTDTSDGSTSTTQAYTVTVAPPFAAFAPTLTTAAHPGYASVAMPSVDASAATPVTWAFSAATNVQTGFAVTAKNGTVTTTSQSPVGSFPVAETATDGAGTTADTPSFNVNIVGPVGVVTPFNKSRPNVALSTNAPLLLRLGADTAKSVSGPFSVTNAIGTPSFTWTSALPGMTLSTAGAMTGAPTGPLAGGSTTSTSTGSIPVTVQDQSTSSTVAGSGQATLAVPFAYYPSTLALTAYANGSYFNGDAVNLPAPTQSGSPVNGKLALNAVSGALPSGLVFNADGSVTGTAGTAGTGTFTATISDDTGGTYTTPSFTLTVSGAALASAAYPSAFANGSGSTPAGSLAALYDGSAATAASLSATSASGVVLTFPGNVAWDGTVDTDLTSGAYGVEYNAGPTSSPSWTAYASGTVASAQFRVTGKAAATPARFRLGYKGAFPHLLPSLTAAKVIPVVGTAYSATLDSLLATANATGTETWTLLSGTVPAGLTLDTQGGTLSGTPTAYGDATLSLAVKDADGVASVPVNLVVSVQSSLQASTTYPSSAIDVGSGATPKDASVVTDGTSVTSVALPVAAGYDASASTGPAAIHADHNYCPAAGGQCSSASYGTSFWSGVQYNFVQAVSWDGSVDLSSTGSPSTALYYNKGSAASPVWATYSASLGPVTTTGVQVVASGSNTVQVTKARLGFGSAYPAYLPSTTATSTVALQGGTVGLDALMTPVNMRSGDTEAWASTALPTGVTVSGSTLQVAASATPGTYAVPMTVADSRGLASAPATLTLTVNAPPALVASTATATYGMAYSGVLNTVMGASNVASGATWTVTGAPSGYAVSGTGTAATLAVAAANQATTGSYPVTVKVANADGGTSTATLTLSVAPGLQATTVSVPYSTAYSGSLVTPMAAMGPSLSWAVGTTGSTFPSGVAVSSTGTLTVAATVAAGTYSAPVTVTSNSQTAMATLTVTVPQANLSTGLMGYWKLDERSGTTAADATGNGYTLTATGASPFPGSGEINGGGAFTGSNYLTGPFSQLTGAAPRTMSVWFRTTSTVASDWLAYGTASTGNLSELGLNSSGLGFIGYGSNVLVASSGYLDGNWHMLTATYDGTTVGVYVDGSLKSSAAKTLATASSAVSLGAFAAQPSGAFTGALDEAGIWSRALSAAEVMNLYASGGGLQGPSFANSDATLYPATVIISNGTAYSGNLATIMNGGVNATKATYAVTSGSLPSGLTLTSAGVLSGTTSAAGNYAPTITATNTDGTTSSAVLRIQASTLVTGLVGYWRLDEASGTTAADATGNGYTLTASSVAPWVSGKINGGGSFNGTTYLSGSWGQVTGASPRTLAAWVMTTTANQAHGAVLSYGVNATGSAMAMGVNGSGFEMGSQGIAGPQASGAYADGNWHLLVGTNDGSTTKLYFDGSLVTTASQTFNTSSGKIYIASNPSGAPYNFAGSVDEAGVWNRALTAAEVTSLYNSGNGLQGNAFAGYGAVLSPASLTGTTGTALSANVAALMNNGVNGTKASWTAASLPSGLTLSTTGVLSGTPGTSGTFAVTVTAKTPDGISNTGTLNLAIGLAALLPVTTDQPVGAAFSQNVAPLMLPSATASWSATGLPAGVTLSSTGLLAGTVSVAGTTSVTVTATPSSGVAGTGTLTLVGVAQGGMSMSSLNLNLTTTSQIYGTNGYANAPYSSAGASGVDLVAGMSLTGASSATFTTAAGTLPPGLSLSSSGVLTGTPTAAGSYVSTVTATSGSLTASAPLYVNVVSTALTADKVYPNASYDGYTGYGIYLANAYDGTETTATGTVTSTNGLGLIFNQPVLTDGSVKVTSGITASLYDKTNGSATGALFSGNVTSKTFAIRPSANANFGTAMMGYQGRFPAPLPSLSATSASLVAGAATTLTLDGAMSAINLQGSEGWTLVSGSLPTGMSMTASGTLYGTPTTAGTFSPVFTVKDSRGIPSIQQTLTITVSSTLQTGLMAYLRLDEGTGSTAYDSVSGNQASFSGSPIWTTAGAVNGAATFNGASQISEPFGKLTGNAPLTMNAWEKTTSTSNATFLSFGVYPNNAQISELKINGGQYGYFGNANDCAVGGASVIADGNWHMVTATFDGSTMTVYKDGSKQTSCSMTLNNGSSGLYVGRSAATRSDLGNFYFTGSVDEPAVWGRALSAAEVSSLYNSGAGKQGPFSDSITAATVGGTLGTALPATQLATAMSGVNVQNATWSVTSGSLPAGMSVSTTGILSGTPTQAGSYPVTVAATNPDGSVASATLTVAVSVTSSGFDGSTSYVSLPSSMLANLYSGSTFNGYTVEGWVNFSSTASYARLFDFASAANGYDDIDVSRYGTSTQIQATITTTPSNYTRVTGGAIATGTWAHLAITQSGATTTIYVNGVSVGTTTTSVVPANVTRSSNFLGKSNYGDAAFAGQMADVQVYNRPLSASEIASTKKGAAAPGIVARYLTTAAQGTDATGNGNAGTGAGTFTTSTFLPN